MRGRMLACLVIAIVMVASVGAALLFPDGGGHRSDPERREVASVLELEEGGLLYTYHVLSGTEALFDLAEDPRRRRNLLLDRPDDARRLRARLELQLGIESLCELRDEHRSDIESLEALGYL